MFIMFYIGVVILVLRTVRDLQSTSRNGLNPYIWHFLFCSKVMLTCRHVLLPQQNVYRWAQLADHPR